tara:strand:+ start:187 stop:510 length:324 start_codon:yes stop_codon:yes gene_type:complete
MIRKKIGKNRAMRKVVNNKTVNSKKTELLSEIDQKLDNIESEYGPIVYNELQSRLEKTIEVFNKEVDSLFSKSFSSYKPKKNKKTKNSEASSKKPKYISDYENSKKD